MLRNILTTVAGLFAMVAVGCSSGGTTYSRGFSEAKFARIKVGMSQAEVTRVAGDPLEKSVYEDLAYTVRDSKGRPRKIKVAYNSGQVYDPGSGLAVTRGVQAGMKRRQVEARLGGQRGVCTDRYVLWSYSRFDYFEGEVRDVAFDENGRVTGVDSYTSRD